MVLKAALKASIEANKNTSPVHGYKLIDTLHELLRNPATGRPGHLPFPAAQTLLDVMRMLREIDTTSQE